MTRHTVQTRIKNGTGLITLDRPKALNSLSLEMVRRMTQALLAWRDDATVRAVVITSSSEKALCAGGDIRFFHEAGPRHAAGRQRAAGRLLHRRIRAEPPDPLLSETLYRADGRHRDGRRHGHRAGRPQRGLRIVTERTKMAMPEVNIGLFPDVGGSYFLSRAPGQLGDYLGVTG